MTGERGTISVTPDASLLRGFEKFREKAEFYGYRVSIGITTAASKHVVDNRSLTWRGFSELTSVLDERHYRENQRYRREHDVIPLVVPSIDESEAECKT
jgi:hypothetical protein